MLRTVHATRYVTPLREGGSLPAIIEADDGGMYVLKFRGAGQGPKALIAELLGGELARALGLPVPELVFVELDPVLARSEPDPEIRELLKASAGLNLALDYLPGAAMFDPVASPPPTASLASDIVWFDAYLTNVDRTPKNPNLLVWHGRHQLIDHGAALYVQHSWTGSDDLTQRSRAPFPAIQQHVLLPWATELGASDTRLRPLLTDARLEEQVAQLPESWLEQHRDASFPSTHTLREAYVRYLVGRREAAGVFVEEALRARHEHV